mmetsp:Transcript_56400/g.120974  ORF Transcript_56400/g.120974 Transcript_56400/m.120974 type:complete len:460 (+) Transcript_56400:3-1382(+)
MKRVLAVWRTAAREAAELRLATKRASVSRTEVSRAHWEIFDQVAQNGVDRLEMLLQAKASPNTQHPNLKRNTCLHIAAEKGFADCVKVLLRLKASVDVRNEFGLKPLALVALDDEEGVFKLLSEAQGTSRMRKAIVALREVPSDDAEAAYKPSRARAAARGSWLSADDRSGTLVAECLQVARARVAAAGRVMVRDLAEHRERCVVCTLPLPCRKHNERQQAITMITLASVLRSKDLYPVVHEVVSPKPKRSPRRQGDAYRTEEGDWVSLVDMPAIVKLREMYTEQQQWEPVPTEESVFSSSPDVEQEENPEQLSDVNSLDTPDNSREKNRREELYLKRNAHVEVKHRRLREKQRAAKEAAEEAARARRRERQRQAAMRAKVQQWREEKELFEELGVEPSVVVSDASVRSKSGRGSTHFTSRETAASLNGGISSSGDARGPKMRFASHSARPPGTPRLRR